MDGAAPSSLDGDIDYSAQFRRSRQLVLASAILVSDISFFSNIVAPEATWRQRLLEAGWTILGYGALRWRNSAPVLAYSMGWVYSAGSALLTVLGIFNFTPFFVLLVTLFAIASQRPLRVSCVALAAVVVPSALSVWFDVHHEADSRHKLSTLIASTLFYLALSGTAWAAGRRSRSAQAAAEHHRRRLALANEAIRNERLRIARELHDILAHTVAVIVLQASGARRVLSSDPASTADALSHIEEVGKKAMDELRRMLALSRSPVSVSDQPSQRGLADIASLLDDALKAGITARLEVYGSPVPVAESIDRTVYRIAQEAVTNIVKHAGPGTGAIVRLTWGTGLRIEIIDDGGGSPVIEADTLSTGQGLLGLAERVTVFGGVFTSGPHRNGFRIQASLPLRAPGPGIPTAYPENETVT